MSFLSLTHLSKRFAETEVLRDVDLQVEAGEFVVLLGASGSGKSTLLRIIAGLEQATSGTLSLAGVDISNIAPRDRGMAMVFQNYALYPHMTVAANMGFALQLAKIAPEERKRRVREVAELLELTALLERMPAALSGGQRQRVAIGRAIVREPKVFLFDEPLSNLDAALRAQMRLELKKLQLRLQTTAVYVTHDQIEAMSLAHRICLLHQGRIVQYDTPEKIYREPLNLFVASFIGQPAMNLLPGTIQADGRTQTLVIGGQKWGELEAGPTGAIVVGLRPPELSLHEDPSQGPAAKVSWVEELGASRLVHLEVAGVALRVELFKPLPASERLSLDLANADLHLFDPSSGARLLTTRTVVKTALARGA